MMYTYALLLVLTALAALPSPGLAWKYERCQLARDLRHKYGFPANQIATLVCIAYHESRYETTAVSKPNTDKSIDYGLYQINSRWWCDRGPSKGCGVSCKDLTIYMDKVMKCVKAVYDETKTLKGDGFKAWTTYKFCQSPASFTEGCQL